MFRQKLHKLATLPNKEIIFRIKEKGYQLFEYSLHQLGCDRFNDAGIDKIFTDCCPKVDAERYFHDFQNTGRDKFFPESYDKDKRSEFIKRHIDYRKWISEAECICSDELMMLGEAASLPSGKGWQCDPLNKIQWPNVFYAHVAGSSEIKNCDIKYVWEVNRHQYLIILAKAYWLTGDEKYAKKVFTIIQDWINSNPYNSGVNWTSSLELAVRVISWIWACFLCRDSYHLTSCFCKQFIKSVYEHGKYIRNHLSIYSSPYNHLIGEIAALHLIGSLFPQFRKGAEWENLAWHVLESEVEKQFHEDGICVEQATFYHHFTLGFYLQAVLLRRLNHKKITARVYSRIEKALEFSMYMTKPDGTLPMIGDIDNARSLYFSSVHSWDFRGFLGLGAVVFNRPDFKSRCDGISDEMLWLLSDHDLTKFLNMKEESPKTASSAFYKSGYYLLRDSWDENSHYLCFDCGEMADGLYSSSIPSAAHGHADALSLELSAHGRPFLVDGGFYTYFGPLEWHKHFRHEESHNTLRIRPFRQAEYCGRLKWQSVKNPIFNQWKDAGLYNYISGKIKYNDACHERQIVYLKKSFWLINDIISVSDTDSSHEAEAFFNFDPSVELIELDETHRRIVLANGDAGILIKYFRDVSITTKKGGEGPSEGWIGLGYGIRRPGLSIRWIKRLENERENFPMLIIPWRKSYYSIREGASRWHPDSSNMLTTHIDLLENSFSISIRKNNDICISGDRSIIEIKSDTFC